MLLVLRNKKTKRTTKLATQADILCCEHHSVSINQENNHICLQCGFTIGDEALQQMTVDELNQRIEAFKRTGF